VIVVISFWTASISNFNELRETAYGTCGKFHLCSYVYQPLLWISTAENQNTSTKSGAIMCTSILYWILTKYVEQKQVTVVERSKACIVFARSEAGIVGSNPTQGMDVWCLCVCVRFSVFVYR
jgi:hypothetical protein